VVTPGFFDVTGVPPAIGRPFTTLDPHDDHYVVLSHGLWQGAFGADPAMVGRTITLDGEPFTVVAVMPPGFDFPDKSQFWQPLTFAAHDLEESQRGARWMEAIGRMRPGVAFAAANAEVAGVAARLAEAHPEKDRQYRGRLVPLLDTMVASVRPALLMLQGAVALVLFIACANVANLFLVRAAGRRAEVAIRASLGASRGRLCRQFLTESLLLGAIGGLAGFGLAVWGVRVLVALDPRSLPRASDVAVAPEVFVFTAAVALAAALVFGIMPALQLVRADSNASLREGGLRIAGGQRRLRASLVVAEMALALVLVAGALLLLRSFANLRHVDKGYDADDVLTFSLFLPEASYSSPERITSFYRALLPAIDSVPGVASAGLIFGLPLGEYNGHSTFSIEGRQVADEDVQNAYVRVIGGEYFQAMRIPLRKGRSFTAADTAFAPLVAILNETAARRYFPSEDPIGHRIRVHATFSDGKFGFRDIVGVVGDVKHRSLADETEPEIYIPYDQQPLTFGVVVVRTTTGPMSVVGGISDRIHALDAALPVANVMPMSTIVADSVASSRFTMILLGVFAALALGLAAVGLYGVMSQVVGQRTREIGVRIAFGADHGRVMRLIVVDGLKLIALGLACGVGGTLLAGPALARLLFGVSATDPLVLASTAGLLVLIALAACVVPARRATRVDPIVALRAD
jgi:putative ABC transport system permease protein